MSNKRWLSLCPACVVEALLPYEPTVEFVANIITHSNIHTEKE